LKATVIDEFLIQNILANTRAVSKKAFLAVLKKARNLRGLSLEEVAVLINTQSQPLIQELFAAAGWVKQQIYGERLVFFAPLYVSDFCVNDCLYCSFHVQNSSLKRKRLTLNEIEEQTKQLIAMGHKRVLVEFGEDPKHNPIDYVVKAIERIYATTTAKGSIRRINVNIAATTVENYRKLKQAKIGTYQLFQETYHRETYAQLHRGPKADYDRQITAYDRAFKAGLDDLGLGVLFGLYDWRFEVLALVAHAQYLDAKYNCGPHTISVPRVQPAPSVTYTPSYKVSDQDFLKLIAILRLSVPYTGMIISTREREEIRKVAFKIGISQSSAASCTTIGGYGKRISQPQFVIQDERPLEEVIEAIIKEGFLPSFCTACYRLGRTGEAFMDISKSGGIQRFCRPNGLLTFAEYLEDFSGSDLYKKGYKLIESYLSKIKDNKLKQETRKRLREIKNGRRDLYF
jgi:2-iminoacetate synthase